MKPLTQKTWRRKRRHARNRAKLSGDEGRPRLIVFRSLKYISGQLVDDASGKTLASSHDMKASTGTKTERAFEAGKALAEAAKKAGVSTCIFDRNGYKYHGRVKAFAEGAREAGLQF